MSSRTTRSLAYDPRVARGMRAQLAHRRELLAAGERSLGWKVGFGSPEAMERLGTTAPLVGFLLASGLTPSGTSVSLAGWTSPALEPEVAAHLGSDLPPGSDRTRAEAAIAAIGPAFELADVDPPPAEVEQILAGNIFQRGVVVGKASEQRSLQGVIGRVTVGDDRTTIDDPQAATGELVSLVQHVADLLGAFGERVRAGEVVITGSIVPPLAVAPGDRVTYELDPLGELSLRFQG